MPEISNAFTDNTVLLNLTLHTPGATKKVKKNQVKVVVAGEEWPCMKEEEEEKDLNQDRFSVSKKIYDSPQLEAIRKHMSALRRAVENESLPADTLKAGMYSIATPKLVKVTNKIKQYQQDLLPLVEDFRAAYPAMVEKAFDELGSVADIKDFPPFEVIEEKISITYNLLSFTTPTKILSRISEGMVEEEENKIKQHWSTVTEQLETGLALSLQGIFDSLSESLTPGKDGRPRKVSEKAIEKYNKILGDVLSNNITQNGGLASIAGQVQALINNATPEELSRDKDIRQIVADGCERLAQELSSLTITETGRQIILRKPKPAAVAVDIIAGSEEVNAATDL